MAKNYYDLIGVSRTATKEEIEAACLLRRKRYEGGGDTGENEAFKKAWLAEIDKAQAVLTDETKKVEYDKSLPPMEPAPAKAEPGDGAGSQAKPDLGSGTPSGRARPADGQKKSLYEILNVDREAPQDDIDQSYAKLRNKYLLMIGKGNPDGTSQLAVLDDAYAILSDRRDDYDRELAEEDKSKREYEKKLAEEQQRKLEDERKLAEEGSRRSGLGSCRTCGGLSAVTAKACPHCGERDPVYRDARDKFAREHPFAVAGVGVIVLLAIVIAFVFVPSGKYSVAKCYSVGETSAWVNLRMEVEKIGLSAVRRVASEMAEDYCRGVAMLGSYESVCKAACLSGYNAEAARQLR